MMAQRLSPGDTIGIVCPSHVADETYYRDVVATIEQKGFRVKLGANIYKNTYGYLASEQERADDFNRMVADDTVKMILFSGEYGANEILPLIDYEAVARHPKLYSSYSDGTNILNAVYAKTGLVVHYGIGAGEFRDMQPYDYAQFEAHFIQGNEARALCGNGAWKTVRPGVCEGILVGGHVAVFAWQLGGAYFRYDAKERYLLFLEDHESINPVAAVGAYLSHIEQNPFVRSVGGLIFGHYSDDVPKELLDRLARFGDRYNVPVVYTDDFGHYCRHAVLPVGVPARLDAKGQEILFI